MSIARAQAAARRFLERLDRKYPTLAAIESFTKIEVYPVAKGDGGGQGCRMPLSQGRVCFTDRLLDGNPRSNCVNLVKWIYDDRKNVEKSAFMEFLAQNTPEHEPPPQQPPKPPKSRKAKGVGMGSSGRLKGRCLKTLFDFWTGITLPEKDTIGKYAVVTARLICKQGLLDEEECLDWLEEAFLALPHQAFSDRLSDDFGELMRVTGKVVEAVYRDNGYQAAPEESGKKLEAVIAYCQQHGVVIHDRSTWPKLPEKASWLSDFGKSEVFRFSYEQRRVLKEEVHPLLHAEDISATYEAAGRIVSFVKNCAGRALAWKLVPHLCGGLGVRWHKNKCCALLKALVRVGFLYVRVEKMWRGNDKALNRARAYGVGAALVEKNVRTTQPSHGASPSSVSIISHSDWEEGTRGWRMPAGGRRWRGTEMAAGSGAGGLDGPQGALVAGGEVVRGPP
jgi:hypothetical protein